jgi:hypothetical protein
MADVDDELMQRVLRAVYLCLSEDHAGWSPWVPRERFVTELGLANARSQMLNLCGEADADSEFVEFLRDHWLPRFRPLPI